ncbi:MAG: putative Ig domain-containing protein [Verrucomicrobia bacterium]|nr:putative Ig domain-containing protein [Verrucomicrobiota bacterium]
MKNDEVGISKWTSGTRPLSKYEVGRVASGDGTRRRILALALAVALLPAARAAVSSSSSDRITLDTRAGQLTMKTSDVPAAIADNALAASSLVVGNLVGTIADVNVNLDVAHPNDSDLTVWLLGPQGTRVRLFGKIGGSGDNFTATVLDDEAGTAIASELAPYTGSFRPAEPLAAFDGQDPNGRWLLEALDDTANNPGTLNQWSLRFNINPAPAAVTLTTVSPLPNWPAGVAYSRTLTVLGGTAPYTWSLASGKLPSDLSLAPATGEISGTPGTPGVASFRVRVEDASHLTSEQDLSLTIRRDSATILFGAATSGAIAPAGESEEWTFFGRAGQQVALVVNPGAGPTPGPAAPWLNWARVEVLDPAAAVLASGASTGPGLEVILRELALPTDGTYTIRVRAATGHEFSTGNYLVTLWDATPDVSPLALNGRVTGRIDTPYNIDRWTFSAVADQQLRFSLLSAANSGIGFDLAGPAGWTGFTGLTGSSAPLTLTTAGSYTLTARSLGGAYGGSYTFRMEETLPTPLIAGTPFAGYFHGSGQARIFALTLATSMPLLLELMNAGADNQIEFFAKLGAPPTRGDYDYVSDTASSSQRTLIPIAAAGTWYVLVYGDYIPTPGNYTLTATPHEVFLTDLTPALGSSAEEAQLRISGAGFVGGTEVTLTAQDGATYAATATQVDSYTQLTATFAATTVPAGIYGVRVNIPGGSTAALPGSFQMTAGGQAELRTSLSVPRSVDYHNLATCWIEYTNQGTAAMPAPLLVLRGIQNGREAAWLTLKQDGLTAGCWTSAMPEGFSHVVQVLGSGRLPGTLQPGEACRIPVYYAGWQQPWDGAYPPIQWQLGVVKTDNPTAVNWADFKDTMKPPALDAAAWDRLWTHFTAQVGGTWGGYVRMLDDNAAYLGRLGQQVPDVGDLLGFEFMQADGLNPMQSLADSVDATVEAPGLPLVFSRSFAPSLTRRYAMGPLGRGWSHNWQDALAVAGDGTVTVTGPGGTRRTFQPDRRLSNNYFAQPGDRGTLRPLGGGSFSLRESDGTLRAFRSDGRLAYLQALNGNTITAAYSGGNLTSLTHNSGASLQLTYHGTLLAGLTDPAGRLTEFTYLGEHLTQVAHPDGRTTHYAYGSGPATHALTEISGSCGSQRSFSYDAQGRLGSTWVGTGDSLMTIEYDGQGGVATRDALGHASRFCFDHRGLMVRSQNPLGQAVDLSFDDQSRLRLVTDAAGRSYRYGYDTRGNLKEALDPLGALTRFTSTTSWNRLASGTDATGNLTRYGYDSTGNLRSITYPDGTHEDWTYNATGTVRTWTNRRGHAVGFLYDSAGRVTRTSTADGTQVSFTYNARGKLDHAVDPHGTTAMEYDGNGRLNKITYPGGRWLQFGYDTDGRRTSSLDQLGHRLDYCYDTAGRLWYMRDETAATIVRYEYDAAGRMKQKTLGNGVYTTYEYDAAGQLLHLVNLQADATVLSRFDYTYDSRGRRTAMDTHYGTWTYGYDDLGQLTRAVLASTDAAIPAQDLTYVYDPLGNRLRTIENGITKAYTTNHLNQSTKVGDTDYVFDLDGNLTEERAPGKTTSYTYNDENRLVGITAGTGNWTYTYDAFGNRVATTENGQATHYVIDPTGLGNVVGEYDGAGSRLAGYDRGYGLLSRHALGEVATYTFDALGNTHELVTGAGAIANRYAYSPFGTELQNTQTVPNPFRFVGEPGGWHGAMGLSQMRNRYYDPVIGKLASPDPLGLIGQEVNLYRYESNNPLLHLAPQGFFPGVELGGLWQVRSSLPVVGLPGLGLDAELHSDGLKNGLGRNWWAPSRLSLPAPIDPEHGGDGTTQVARITDPNNLIGPGGYGPQHHVPAANILPYRINFQNDSSATAPAQQVLITDPLSPHLDWSTFELTEIGFGDRIIPLPPASQYFETRYECTVDGHDLVVDIFAGIDLGTGQAYCRFHTLDPATELPPTGHLGFLPPEDGTGRGQGFFSFVIKARPGLPSGTAIRNIAYLSFDGQPTTTTNQLDPHQPAAGTDPDKEALVTLDDGPPTLTLTLTPTGAGGTNIDVRWTGDDRGGVGIKSYDVQVSLNGGPFEAWLTDTRQTQATYPGYFGQGLRFQLSASDFLGQQAPPTTATTVIADDEYLHWRAAVFGTAVGDPALRNTLWSDTADPDGDGRSNLLEFLAATDPLLADARFNPTTYTVGGSQIYSYRLTKVANHRVDHSVQWSPDGVHWFTDGLVFRVAEDHADHWLMEAVLALNGQPPVQFRQVAERDVTYNHWIYEEGAAFSQRGPCQDPNGDRIPNAVAYALGLPAVGPVPAADLARLPKAVLERTPGSRGGIVLGLPERMQPDLTLSIEASPSLAAGTWGEVARRSGTGAWQMLSPRHPAVRTQPSGGVEVTTLTEDLTAQRFYRLRAKVSE